MLGNLGKYELLGVLGTGGQGTVYRARDQALDRMVAVKVVRQDLAHDEKYLRALFSEARVAGSLNHPNITVVYDLDVIDGKPYIAMELAQSSLSSRLENGVQIPFQEAVQITIAICSGLEHCHANNVIHRDIKPQNILLASDGHPKLTDFGIARPPESTTRAARHQAGTVTYMSPEQITGTSTDGRSDIYSLGVVLYEMLTGSPPFVGETEYQVLNAHIHEPVPSMSPRLGIPSQLEEIVFKSMEKRPENRFASANAMVTALRQLLVGMRPREKQSEQAPQQAAGAPVIPEGIHRYENPQRLGEGAFGTVYRAQDSRLGRTVAIKDINLPDFDDPEFNQQTTPDQYIDSILREPRLASRLQHPNIVTVHDFLVEEHHIYIVMEFLPDSLNRHIRPEQPIPYRRAVEMAIQVCRGLSHAHTNGVVHRDIKPPNILLTEDGTVKISDFGLARQLTSSARVVQTHRIGDISYASPEQLNNRTIDHRTDIYALGVTLFEMLTGSLPFRGESQPVSVERLEAPVPPMPGHLAVPSSVEDVVRRAMAKSPEDRFANVDAMATALEGALAVGQVREPQPSQPPSVGTAAVSAGPSRPPGDSPSITGDDSFSFVEAIFGRGFSFNPRRHRRLKILAGVIFFAACAVVLYIDLTTSFFDQPWDTVEDLGKAIQEDPDNAMLYIDRGYAYNMLGEHQRAIQDFDKAIQIDPENAVPYNNRGYAYNSLGEHQRAIQDFDKAIQIDPDSAIIYNHRGWAYNMLGEHQRAIQDFDKAIQIDPENAVAYDHRGYAYNMLGEHQRAIQDLDKAIQLDPENAVPYIDRGNAYSSLGEYQRAIQDFDKAIRLDPENAMPYNNRGIAYSDLGQHQRAIQDFDKNVQLDPENTVAYSNRGWAYNSLGEYQRAIQDLDKAIQLDPENALGYKNRGYAYDALGEHQRAIQDLDKAIELDPDLAQAYQIRGYAYRTLGEDIKADADKAKACSLDSQYC